MKKKTQAHAKKVEVHQEKPAPKVELASEPKIPYEDVIKTLLVNAYRFNQLPDISHLSERDKKLLLELIEQDSKAETIFKFPERENLRAVLRKLL